MHFLDGRREASVNEAVEGAGSAAERSVGEDCGGSPSGGGAERSVREDCEESPSGGGAERSVREDCEGSPSGGGAAMAEQSILQAVATCRALPLFTSTGADYIDLSERLDPHWRRSL